MTERVEVGEPTPIVWVTGAGGLIGSYIMALAPRVAADWQVEGITRARLDLADHAAVARVWRQAPPSIVIHCAAMSKAAACEADPAAARTINVEATANLAELARDIPFIFLSTDHVFDGRKGAYVESDPVNPLTWYGRTKADAERRVGANPRHTIVRTSLNAGLSSTGDRSFLEETVSLWKARKPARLFVDEFRSPIPASVTARALWELARRNEPGVYHLAGRDRLSRWEIGHLLAAQYPELAPTCVAGSLQDYQGPPRAPDLSMDCTKLQARLSFQLPGFQEWLAARSRNGRDAMWTDPSDER